MKKELNTDGVAQFQKILDVLLQYERKQFGRLMTPSLLVLGIIEALPPHQVQVMATPIDDESSKMYLVECKAHVPATDGESVFTFVHTQYVHDDRIVQERITFRADLDHPVHAIVCLTDLYERFTIEA